MDSLTGLLAELVSIASVNPMGRALVGPEVLETRLTGFLEDWFGRHAIDCRRQPVAPGRDNLYARFESSGSPRTLLFDVHQDTVPTDGMTIDPFLPRIDNGRHVGQGGLRHQGRDGGHARGASQRLCRERPPRAASVVLACTVDEEFTHTGASQLAATPHGADLAIVAEPTLLDLVHCHKGAVRWKIRTRGVACHSSTPERGVNAIYRMGRVLDALAEYAGILVPPRPTRSSARPVSRSAGSRAGKASTSFPTGARSRSTGASYQASSREQSAAAIRRFLGDRLGSLAATWSSTRPGSACPPWFPALDAVGRAAQGGGPASATGREPRVVGVPYGTDAGPLGAGGLPCVVFGPGDIAQAHTKDEWVELDQVTGPPKRITRWR